MSEKGWSNKGVPSRMKKVIRHRSDHKRSQRAKDVSKFTEAAVAPHRARPVSTPTKKVVTESKPVTIRDMGVMTAARQKSRVQLKQYPSTRQLKEDDKPVLTHRARRMARKLFPKRRHDWKLHPVFPIAKGAAVAQN